MEGRKINGGNEALKSFGISYSGPSWNWIACDPWNASLNEQYAADIIKFQAGKSLGNRLWQSFCLVEEASQARKAKGLVCGEAHRAGQGRPEPTILAPLPYGASWALFWFQICKGRLVSPFFTCLTAPPTLHHSGEWLLPVERKEGHWSQVWSQEERGALSPQPSHYSELVFLYYVLTLG